LGRNGRWSGVWVRNGRWTAGWAQPSPCAAQRRTRCAAAEGGVQGGERPRPNDFLI
jgi:hypothetical protein